MLRLVYSRFATQEIFSNKLESEGEALQPVDHEYLQEAPEMTTDPLADHLIKRQVVDV